MLPNDFKAQRWRPFYNAGASEVPAFGLIEVTGMSLGAIGSNTYPIISGKRPTSASLQGAAVNSHLPVPVGAQGICTFDAPMWALYDTGSTPAYDEDWGTQANSYLLGSGNTGFKIIGGQTSGRVYVERRASSSSSKILYLPLNDSSNYMLPQLANSCYGYEWTVSASLLSNLDTGTSYTIKDYYGSIALPGQKVWCQFSTTLNAWTPIPFGQNALQLVRTYKTIPAGETVNGDDMFFVGLEGGVITGDLFECSELVNDEFFFDWAHSNVNIEADNGNPAELFVYLFHENGGCHWRIIGRSCNTTQLQ